MSVLLGLLRHVNTSIATKNIEVGVFLSLFRRLKQFAMLGLRLSSYCVYSKPHASTCHSFTFLSYTAEHLRESKCFHRTVMQKSPKKRQGNAKVKKKSLHSFRGDKEPKQSISPPT